jgi:LPXTG-motif cell wall-anchored protein
MSLTASTARRLAASTFIGGLAVVPVLMAPAAEAAPECYSGTTTSQTTLSINPTTPTVSQPFTVTANVTTAGVPAASGTVTFSYAGSSQPVAVSGGTASAGFTAQATPSNVTAAFAGECTSGGSSIGFSSQTTPVTPAPTVGGVQASSAPNVSGRAAPQVAGTLASTGVDRGTELFALAGAGLVAAGGVTLLVRRRRSQA